MTMIILVSLLSWLSICVALQTVNSPPNANVRHILAQTRPANAVYQRKFVRRGVMINDITTIDNQEKSASFELERNLSPSEIGFENSFYSVSVRDSIRKTEAIRAYLMQQQSSSRPFKTYLPTTIRLIGTESDESSKESVKTILQDILCWYLDHGGRLFQLVVQAPSVFESYLLHYGFEFITEQENNELLKGYKINSKAFVEAMMKSGDKDSVALNIIGRVLHGDFNQPSQAIPYYTKSLQLKTSSYTFANLGSAYHATGELQLAFASYQQALQIDPANALVYLKLALFYDDFAKKDWVNASSHAEKCYRYYLQQVDPEDTAILVRLGNLLVRDSQAAPACDVFDIAVKVDPTLESAWFNKAHAQLQLRDYKGAAKSLQQTLALNPRNLAAKHMLSALDDELALGVTCADEQYVKDLFDNYALDYDEHGKKLLYSAPRVIRQELAKLYKTEYALEGKPTEVLLITPVAAMADNCVHDGHDHNHNHDGNGLGVDSSCSTYTSFVNQTLDILDLGCGTGQVGAWLKDYARTLVGVDISKQMLEAAKRKGLYNSLHNMRLETYLDSAKAGNEQYDIVVAAEVISYLGDLQNIIQKMADVVKPNGKLVITAEALIDLEEEQASSLQKERGFWLMKTGRFAYTEEYLNKMLSSIKGSAFNVEVSKRFSPRLNNGEPVPGFLIIAKRVQ